MNVLPVAPAQAGSLFAAQASIVTSSAWLEAFDSPLQAYAVMDRGEPQAVLSLRCRKLWGCRSFLDPQLAPHCGLVLQPRAAGAEKLHTWRKDVLTALAGFLCRPGTAFLSLTLPDWIADFQPFIWRGCKVLARSTYQIRLQGRDDAELLADMSETRRRQLRTTGRHGLAAALCTQPEIIERLVSCTMARQQARSDGAAVARLVRGYGRSGSAFAFAASLDGRPVAVCFCAHDAGRCYYLLGGVDQQRTVPAAAPLAMLACIRHARDLGLRVFDFEGSDIPGVERYFRSFGAVLTPVHRVVKAWLPIELALKPFRRALL